MSAAPTAATELAGKRVVIMGLGLFGGGAAAARFAAAQGARVVLTDLRRHEDLAPALASLGAHAAAIELVLGEHRESDFTAADVVVANPAVALDHPLLAAARACGARITSEMELCLERLAAPTAAISGTQGKSSTTLMAGTLATRAGLPAHFGGNLGKPLVETAATLAASDRVVLELSSYQLEALGERLDARGGFAAVRAIALLDVLPDHLARHGTFAAYTRAKARLFELPASPGAVAILPARGVPEACERAARSFAGELVRYDLERPAGGGRALWIEDGRFRFGDEVLGEVRDLRLPGGFQRRNALAALGLARVLGATPAALASAIATLEGLPHRVEELGSFAGRRVIDNGVSTTPDSTLAALQDMPAGTILLVGGEDKGLPWDETAAFAARRGLRVIAFGGSRERLAAIFRAAAVATGVASGVREAVEHAFDGEPGDTILFSPGCASFDAYLNFEARARDFRAAVRAAAAQREALST